MNLNKLRLGVATSALAGALLVSPTESKAIFHWCRGCGQPAAAYAPAPAYVPPSVSYYTPQCNTCAVPVAPPCAPPTVVNYVPQTCYRPVSVAMPVTTYQPVAACGPCGTPTTVMRPVTTFATQTQYVPYTTYRMVVTPAYVPAPVAVNYAPAPVAPAPSCCSAGTATMAAPAIVTPGPAPMAPAPMAPAPMVPGVGAPTPTPALPPTGPANGGVQQNQTPMAPDVHLRPTPEESPLNNNTNGNYNNGNNGNSTNGTNSNSIYNFMPRTDATSAPPRYTDPDPRTAARPLPTYRPVVNVPQYGVRAPVAPVAPQPVYNGNAWRPSAR